MGSRGVRWGARTETAVAPLVAPLIAPLVAPLAAAPLVALQPFVQACGTRQPRVSSALTRHRAGGWSPSGGPGVHAPETTVAVAPLVAPLVVPPPVARAEDRDAVAPPRSLAIGDTTRRGIEPRSAGV